MLSEISQPQKVKYCTIPLIRSIQNSQIHKLKEGNSSHQELGGGDGRVLVLGHFSLCLILYDPMNHSPPSSSVYGVFQARILE